LKIFFEDQIIDFLKLDKIDNVNYNYDSFVSVQGAEALHARMLFERLFGKKFIRFDEENDENRFINSTLNYGFSIILSAFCRSIVKNGYDTRISLFHKSFSNHFALASDLMEPFRILITFYTYKVIRKLKKEHLILSSEIKTQLIKILEEDMYYNNERIRISIGIDKYVFDILNDKEFKIEFIYDIN
jgi:CRISPR-associated protein Cas1